MSVAILEGPNDTQLFCGGLTFGQSTTPLQEYGNTVYTSAVTGAISGSTTCIFRYIGGIATLSCTTVTNSTSSAGDILLTTLVPILPIINMDFPIWVENNSSTFTIGNCRIGTNGQVTISAGIGVPFSGAGITTFDNFTVVYPTL